MFVHIGGLVLCLHHSGEINLSSVSNEENKIINEGHNVSLVSFFFNEAEIMIVLAVIIEKLNSTQTFYKFKPSTL